MSKETATTPTDPGDTRALRVALARLQADLGQIADVVSDLDGQFLSIRCELAELLGEADRKASLLRRGLEAALEATAGSPDPAVGDDQDRDEHPFEAALYHLDEQSRLLGDLEYLLDRLEVAAESGLMHAYGACEHIEEAYAAMLLPDAGAGPVGD